jgi:hypothetical protein
MSIRSNRRTLVPVWFQAIGEIGVEYGCGGGLVLFVTVARNAICIDGLRDQPMPVEHSHIGIVAGRGMPTKQMIVINTHLALAMMVTDIVEIRLGQRNT